MATGQEVGSISIRIGANWSEVERAFRGLEARTETLQRRLADVGRTLTTRVTLPLAGFGAVAFGAAARLESLEMALAAVSGGAAETEAQLARLREVAKLPGLGFAEAVQGATQLQAVGRSAEDAANILQQFGNAIASVGGGRFELERVVMQLTQMSAAGKVLQADLRPIIQTAPLVGRAMQEAFGTIDPQEIERLGISADEFISRLTAQLATLPRVAGGLANLRENALDAVQQGLRPFGEAIGRVVAPAIEALTGAFGRVSEAFARLPERTQTVAVILGAVAAAAGPVALALGGLVSTLPLVAAGFTLLTGPIGLVVAGAAAVTAGFVLLYRESAAFREALGRLGGTVRDIGARLLGTFRETVDTVLALWRQFGGQIVALLETALTTLIRVTDGALRTLTGAFGAATATIQGDFKGLKESLLETAEGITEIFWGIVEGIGQATIDIIEYFRRIGSAASVTVKAVREVRLLVTGDKGAAALGLPDYASIFNADPAATSATSSGATAVGATAKAVRDLAAVTADLRRRMEEAGLTMQIGLINRTDLLREKAQALRSAFSEAFNLEGATARVRALGEAAAAAAVDAEYFAAMLPRLNVALRELSTNPPDFGLDRIRQQLDGGVIPSLRLAATWSAELNRAFESATTEDARREIGAYIIALDKLAKKLGEAREEVAEVVVGMERAFQEGALRAVEAFGSGIGDAFGRLTAAFVDFSDNFKGVSDLGEAFKQFGRDILGTIPRMLEALAAAIARMAALRLLWMAFGSPTGGFFGGVFSSLGVNAGVGAPVVPAASAMAPPVAPAGTGSGVFAGGNARLSGTLRGESRITAGAIVTMWEAGIAERELNGYGGPRRGG